METDFIELVDAASAVDAELFAPEPGNPCSLLQFFRWSEWWF